MAPGQGRGVHVAAALRCSPQPRPRSGPQIACGSVRTRLWPKVRRESGGGADCCPPGQYTGEGVREACTCSGPRGLGFGPRKSLRTFDCPTWRRSRAGPRVAVLTGKSAPAFLPGSHGPGAAPGTGKARGPWRRARLSVAREGSRASPRPHRTPSPQPGPWAVPYFPGTCLLCLPGYRGTE